MLVIRIYRLSLRNIYLRKNKQFLFHTLGVFGLAGNSIVTLREVDNKCKKIRQTGFPAYVRYWLDIVWWGQKVPAVTRWIPAKSGWDATRENPWAVSSARQAASWS